MAATNPSRIPFPAWRLPNGIINARDNELERSIGSCERWEWFGGFVVVAALIAEVAIAAIHPPYDSFLEQWGSVLSTGLIAIGVVIEIKFAHMAGLRQSELRRRSDERAFEANLRAAEAIREAERIKEKISPRRLTLQQFNSIVVSMRGHPIAVSVRHVGNNEESATYAGEIAQALIAANPFSPIEDGGEFTPDRDDLFRLRLSPLSPVVGGDEALFRRLLSALQNAGLSVLIGITTMPIVTLDVGKKPPPSF
jgi:hypothetical protein